MFCLSIVEQNLHLPPRLLSLPLLDALKEELERLFLDKVIPNLGLCISVYDIRSLDGGFISSGEGAPSYKVVCRLLMFRPSIGEILRGKLTASDANVSLGFFDDISIPVDLLPQQRKMGEDGIWIWEYEDAELTMDLDEEVYFRVNKVKYPPIPLEQAENAPPYAPMEIIGEIHESGGLGLVSWWEE